MTTDITYRLQVLGERGMYSHGHSAMSPELARLATGDLVLRRDGSQRLSIERVHWVIDRDGERHVDHIVVMDAETTPGEWGI